MLQGSGSKLVASYTIAVFLIVLNSGCDKSPGGGTGGSGDVSATLGSFNQEGVEVHPLADRGEQDGPLFERLDAGKTGIDVKTIVDESHARKYLYHSAWSTGGIAIGDVNNDDRPDIFIACGLDANRLYIQEDGLRFRDDASAAGVGGEDAWAGGAAMVDIDNDGDLDIYVCNYDQPNQLYINERDGKYFREAAVEYGLAVADGSLLPAFCDYDNDGDLDLYILTSRLEDPKGRSPAPPVYYVDGVPHLKEGYERYYAVTKVAENRYEVDVAARADFLFENNGDGTFTDVTERSGIAGRSHGLAATWFDFNRDGLTDLYISNDYADPDHLYRNNGDGTFTDVAADHLPYTPWFSMGADCADVNNDGRFDLFTTDMAATTHYKAKISMGDMSDKLEALTTLWPRQIMHNCLFIDSGAGRYEEIALMAGVAKTDWTWGVRLSDFDNDGRVDLFVTNGAARHFSHSDFGASLQDRIGKTDWDMVRNNPRLDEANLAFRNNGDLSFENVSAEWGLDYIGASSAAAQGDLDGDGDLDLVVMNLDEPVHVYRNQSTTGHRVLVRLRGTQDNARGLGAVVTIETDTGEQIRQMNPTTGFQSHNEDVIHFGLGDSKLIKKMQVRWPNGQLQTIADLPADHLIVVTQRSGSAGKVASDDADETDAMFVRANVTDSIVHRETPFDDFKRQPLLPGKHSQLGPGLAVGDFDGDGTDDFFVGGAAGQAGSICFNRDGRFEVSSSSPLAADKASEDMGALAFDADGDGDLDLYVVSGSVECEPDAEVLRDRLYLNDGKGAFTKAAPDALPDVRDSGSCVVGADFDRDGDVDLFVGGRVVPGQFPVTPNSRLLRNDGGRFSDVTDVVAPGLREVGLVSAALWSDATGDGRLDLLIACEWGPIHTFAGTPDGLVDRTKESGVAELTGWWNGISGGDVDRDGDVDYVVTNVGLNTKYGMASKKKPAYLYYGDFEKKGRMRLVEAKPGKDGLLPVRGLSCSSNAMPMVRDRLPTFHEFASASLDEIYTPQALSSSLELVAMEFQSGVLINEGGSFTFKPFPRLAQSSPGYGVIVHDFDGDHLPDVYMVQNFYTREPETGLWRGGISLLLKGDGRGDFAPVSSPESGLVVAGDAKGLAFCDINADGTPDLLVTQNDDAVLDFVGRSPESVADSQVSLLLGGSGSNVQALGATVSVRTKDGLTQIYEIYGGNGYLSQSSTLLFLTQTADQIADVTVQWPDGTKTNVDSLKPGRNVVTHTGETLSSVLHHER